MTGSLVVASLADRKRYVAVLDHVLDLSAHCQTRHVSPSFVFKALFSNARLFRNVTYLSFHGVASLTRQREQNDPVHHQHGPEDGHVEHLGPGAGEGDEHGARGADPELELGQAADEGAELLVLLDGQRGAAAGAGRAAVLERLVLGERGVELGLQEGEEEVEEVDAEGVGDCFETRIMSLASALFQKTKRCCGKGRQRGPSSPMYHPSARTIRRKKKSRSTPVPIQR